MCCHTSQAYCSHQGHVGGNVVCCCPMAVLNEPNIVLNHCSLLSFLKTSCAAYYSSHLLSQPVTLFRLKTSVRTLLFKCSWTQGGAKLGTLDVAINSPYHYHTDSLLRTTTFTMCDLACAVALSYRLIGRCRTEAFLRHGMQYA